MDGQDGDKGCGVQLGDLIQQLLILALVQNSDDLAAGTVVVSAMGLVDGTAGIQIVQDELLELVLMLGNDADALALDKAEDEMVEDDAGQIGADDGQNGGLEIIEENRRTGDDHTGEDRRLADIDAEELVEDLGDDIDTARRGVKVEQNGLADGTEEDKTEQVGQRIAHDGTVHRRIAFKQTYDSRQQDRSIDRFNTKLIAQQQEAEDEQDNIEDHRDGGDAEGNDIGNQHGKARYAAEGQTAGDHEEIDCCTNQCGAQCDGKHLGEEFDFFHIKKPPMVDFRTVSILSLLAIGCKRYIDKKNPAP